MSLEYISSEKAYDEACERLENRDIQESTLEYLGGVLPPGFENTQTPLAVFAPYLAKGSQTEVEFLSKAAGSGFKTLVATYKGCEYVTANAGLVDCFRPPLLLSKGQQTRNYVVPEYARRGAVGEATTIYGGLEITDYWNNLRVEVLKRNELPTGDRVADFGAWYKVQAERFGWTPAERAKSPYYYMALMALYASGRAVLFDVPSAKFDGNIILLAANAVKKTLGLKPLLVNELTPSKRDWTDLSFLSKTDCEILSQEGKIR